LIFILVALNLSFEDGIKALVRSVERGTALGSGDAILAQIHIWGGISIIALVVIRLALRLFRGVPESPSSGNALLDKAGHWTHLAFYVLLFAVPGTGAIGWFMEVEPLLEVHEVGQNLLLILMLAHIAAALVHQFWFKDNLLMRMLRPN
jgi:cytochrome b561